MRAVCEACEQPQPLDWKPGDLCIHCGQAARREVRCFWCSKWTPAGKFCRRCGAAVVEERLYGAARMLKDAGTDRFNVPKMLVDLDPDQIDNFTNIYQRHAAVMARHVDHLRFLERFLHQRHWSEELHESLITQLPWQEEKLESLSPQINPIERSASSSITQAESLALAITIQSITPFADTRALAIVVRFLLDDWTVHRDVSAFTLGGSPAMRAEAALAVTSWRALYSPCELNDRWSLIGELKRSPIAAASVVRRLMLGDESATLPPDAVTSDDPDISFSAAIITSDIDRLTASASSGDELQRFAAGSKLARIGAFGPVGAVLLSISPEHQLRLLREIEMRRKPVPALRNVLFELADGTASPDIRKFACFCLCYGCPPHEGLRIAKIADGKVTIYQALLQRADLPPEELEEFGLFLVARGAFARSQSGMDVIAKKGRMPASFVPRNWGNANEQVRIEFCGFAEMQLEDYADEELHRFLVSVVFGNETVPVTSAAWTSLYRWYGRTDHSEMGPLLIKSDPLKRFFGSAGAFAAQLTRFLRRPELREITETLCHYQNLAKFLRYSDEDVLPEFAAEKPRVNELIGAVAGMMRNREIDFMLRLAGVDFLGLVGGAPEFHDLVESTLRTFLGTDLDLASTNALTRIGR